MTQLKFKNAAYPERVMSRMLSPLFSDLFQDIYQGGQVQGRSTPAVNISENNEAFVLEIAAPGLGKEDFKIKVEKDILHISAEKTLEESKAEKNYSRREFNYQKFQRSFTLPELVDQDAIHANYSEGILHVTIAKKADQKPLVKEIPII